MIDSLISGLFPKNPLQISVLFPTIVRENAVMIYVLKIATMIKSNILYIVNRFLARVLLENMKFLFFMIFIVNIKIGNLSRQL